MQILDNCQHCFSTATTSSAHFTTDLVQRTVSQTKPNAEALTETLYGNQARQNSVLPRQALKKKKQKKVENPLFGGPEGCFKAKRSRNEFNSDQKLTLSFQNANFQGRNLTLYLLLLRILTLFGYPLLTQIASVYEKS